MKSLQFLLLTFILFSCSNPQRTRPQTNVDAAVGAEIKLPEVEDCGYQVSEKFNNDWQLIFEDEFDDAYANGWNAWNSGAYNEELQHYQSENIATKNGFLFLCARRESVQGNELPTNQKPKNFNFTSGRLESKERFGPKNVEGQKTVKFSSRLKLVEGQGMWPAWWSYGHPWPTAGEIDILEARGHTPREFSSCFHYGEKPGITDTKPALNEFHFEYPEKLTECFHVYEMEWSEDSFKIFFDEELVKIYDAKTYPFVKSFWEKEHMLCLNLAVGGNFFKNRVDESEIPNEAFYIVDWVKVYQK